MDEESASFFGNSNNYVQDKNIEEMPEHNRTQETKNSMLTKVWGIISSV